MVAVQSEAIAASDYKLSETSSVMLDLIRFAAAQVVLIGHTIRGLEIGLFLQPPYVPFIQNMGVVMFFVLSGFLIPYIVFPRARQGYDFASYFIDRFSRIYSGYLPAILFVIVVDTLNIAINGWDGYIYADAFNLKTLIGNVFMLQDYPFLSNLNLVAAQIGLPPVFGITSFGSARNFWTLAIEWWLYLSFGWLVLSRHLHRTRAFMFWLVLLFFSIVPLWNLVFGRGDGLTMMWLAGLLVYVIMSRRLLPALPPRLALALSAGSFVLAILRAIAWTDAYDLIFAVMLAVSLYLLLTALDSGKWTFSSGIKRFIRLGASFSFTLYLTHLTLYDIFMRWIEQRGEPVSPYLLFMMILVFSNAIALVLAWFTEMRHKALAHRLKQRYYRRVEREQVA